jgi:hypothetical protein
VSPFHHRSGAGARERESAGGCFFALLRSALPRSMLKRKARDSNPHDLSAARFSKPARQPLSGCPQ